MNNYPQTIQQLKARITKLERDKELLRLYLHELIEAYYRTVNQQTPPRKDQPQEQNA